MDYALIKKNEFRIVSIGRLHKIKNYADMVKIIYELRNRNINAYLDIFGDGQEKNNIIKFCDSLGLSDYVVLRGNTNNVYNELINHDVFIMTSVQEGFPNSLSEAMAVGLPSLSYLCHDGFKDLISDGNDGYLIPYGDIEHFVDVLVELYKSRELRKKIGEESKKIQFKFSQEKIMKDWNSLISKLV
jgi:glycosyltransferase involved in cell wall biosynthesis